MNILQTSIRGVSVVETTAFRDERGLFARLYCEKELAEIIGQRRIVQTNHSRTHRVGAVRGLHYLRPPHAEMKLVRCLKGRVWDLVIDLRAGSPTFLQWHAEELTPDNTRMLVIPEECAHGFQVLEANSELLYLHTVAYHPEADSGVAYNDPVFNITWPLPVTELSQRDRQHAMLGADFLGLKYEMPSLSDQLKRAVY